MTIYLFSFIGSYFLLDTTDQPVIMSIGEAFMDDQGELVKYTKALVLLQLQARNKTDEAISQRFFCLGRG